MDLLWRLFRMNLASTETMCMYEKQINICGHFNTPLLYGPAMSGKTLSATCASHIIGGSRSHIVSRYNMSTEVMFSIIYKFLNS